MMKSFEDIANIWQNRMKRQPVLTASVGIHSHLLSWETTKHILQQV